jgi:hypothetical protein
MRVFQILFLLSSPVFGIITLGWIVFRAHPTQVAIATATKIDSRLLACAARRTRLAVIVKILKNFSGQSTLRKRSRTNEETANPMESQQFDLGR